MPGLKWGPQGPWPQVPVMNISVQVYVEYSYPRFQILTAANVSMKMVAYWDTARCSLAEEDRRFRVSYWFHHQCDKSLTTFEIKFLIDFVLEKPYT